ncbi:type VI immunity family protein [Aliihoeflea sp. PC F10.4]
MTDDTLDEIHSSAIDEIRLTDDRGFTIGRVGFAVELYFENGDTVERREALVGIAREYHGYFAGELSHYLKVDASRLSRIDGDAYLDYYAGKAATLKPNEPLDASIFGYPGGAVVDEPVPVSMSFSAAGPHPLAPLGLSYLNVYFPASFVAAHGYAHLVEITRKWASVLKAAHGTAGYSVLLEQGEFGAGGVMALMPALKRFPGLDFSDPGMFLVEASAADVTSIKSINWLTVLGDDALAKLGGPDAVAQKLGPTCQVHSYPGGAILQAGDVPQLGDRNRAIVLDEYRRVAELVRPIRFSAYKRGLFVLGGGEDEREETRKWLQRFD